MSESFPDVVEQGQSSDSTPAETPAPEASPTSVSSDASGAAASDAASAPASAAASTAAAEATTSTGDHASAANTDMDAPDSGINFSERYSEILGKVNQSLDSVDWNQMGRIGKATGVIVAVIVAQILIKGVLDTINLIPIVPGLLELLGLVVVGQWSWTNLTTSEKRNAVISRIQNLRREYLG